MNTIIVATDYSTDATVAVEYAAALCRKVNARLLLFNSFVIPTHAANTLLPVSGLQHIIDSNRGILWSMARMLSQKFSIEVLFESSLNDINEELDMLVKKYHADIVVMGMKGQSLERKLFGNTTLSVIKHARYPVLTVPQKVVFSDIKKVVFACDHACTYIETTLNTLKSIFSDLHARVEVFFVQHEPLHSETDTVKLPDHPEVLDALSEESMLEFKAVSGLHILKSVREEVKASQADLLVMVPQQYKFWESIVHISKTGLMASQSEVPLLAVPNRTMINSADLLFSGE